VRAASGTQTAVMGVKLKVRLTRMPTSEIYGVYSDGPPRRDFACTQTTVYYARYTTPYRSNLTTSSRPPSRHLLRGLRVVRSLRAPLCGPRSNGGRSGWYRLSRWAGAFCTVMPACEGPQCLQCREGLCNHDARNRPRCESKAAQCHGRKEGVRTPAGEGVACR
jgi:hypothetical protein